MKSDEEMSGGARQLFDRDEVEGVLSGAFYTPAGRVRGADDSEREKPSHYKVICISMYIDALEKLDAMVRELKLRGYTKANRSALIRHALSCIDLDSVPRGL
jgi:hypothetical protein